MASISKRKTNQDRIPIVEKLYKQNQESYYSAGGFDAGDNEFEEKREKFTDVRQKKRDKLFENVSMPDKCMECTKPLYDSFLWEHYNYPVYDKEKHKLIARTEAKTEFLLKDCDLDLRKPILRFISKKNPHNPRYGDMKLYLKIQIEDRALEIFESFELLEEAKESRQRNREIQSEKKFEKKIKQMRKEIRGDSNIKLSFGAKHNHEYGEEVYNKKNDSYTKICATCGYEMNYEKF